MHKSKLLALLLAVVMVASMIVVPVYAAGGEIAVGMTADKTTVEPGGTVTLTMALTNNSGFSTVNFKVVYSGEETWGIASRDLNLWASNLSYEEGTTMMVPSEEDAKDQIVNIITYGAAGFTGTGDLASLTYTAPQAAGEYTFTLEVQFAEDVNGAAMTVTTSEPLTITVAEGEAAEVECEKCGAADWTEIAEGTWTGGALATGHYKLTGNQTLTAALEVSSDVCVDLNGYSITASGTHRVFESTGILAIMDSGETGTIFGGELVDPETGIGADDKTESKWGGSIFATGSSAKLYIYGGTIQDGVAARGGNICLASSAELYMYGGTVKDGTAYRAGNIQVAGTGNIYSGTISGGTDTYGAPNLLVASASGGPYSTMNIFGGTFTGGETSSSSQGSVYTLYSTLNIYGGSITREKALYAAKGTSKGRAYINIYGGTISGSITKPTSSGNYAYCNIYNGVFTEDISAYKADCACVFGNTVWHYASDCACDYTTALTQYSQYITQKEGQHTLSGDAETGYSCASCETPMEAPSTKEGACPVHGDKTWQAWDGVASDGHYYVAGNFTLPGQVTVAAGETLCLDLNGQTVNACESTRMFLVEAGGTLTLMDSAEDGTLQGTEIDESGAVVSSAGTFNLYSGTIQDGFAHNDGNIYGGNIYINGGSFNMYGGTVKDGKVINTSSDNAYGGNIYIVNAGTTATISGGNILNGDAGYRGGNIGLNTGATMTIEGDVTVEGGAAATYNSAGNGANIFVAGTSSLTIKSGVTIGAAGENNEAAANIIKASKATLVIKAGVATYELPETYAEYLEPYTVYNTIKDAADVTYYVTYATLANALTAAKAGDTVNLATEIKDAGEIILDGVTLNLNGKALTATTVNATAHGHVVDSTDGLGQLKATTVDLADNNNMQHIVVDGVSYFENVEIENDFYSYESGASKAKYYMYVDKAKDNTKVDEALEEGTLRMGLLVTWNDGTDDREKTFVLDNEDLIEAYVNDFDGKMLVVTITGLENVTLLGCEATLVVPVEA